MSSRAERRRSDRSIASLLLALALAWTLALGGALPAAAQTEVAAAPQEWDATVAEALERVEDPDVPTPELELLRDRLLRMRSAAIELEASASPKVADATARLQALGSPPAEGAAEPAEIAQRREQINAELSLAQVPVLESQDFQRRADALIRDIDRVVRARFSAELRSRGPSPLAPRHWVETGQAVVDNLRAIRGQIAKTLADPVARARLVARVPLDLVLALVGIAITFSLRRRLVAWVEGALARATSTRSIALLVNLRNFSRLIVPAVGAGLLFGALDPAGLLDPDAETPLFVLPSFVLAIIGAGWLGGNLFAPKLAAYRLVPVVDADAATGARLAMGLGAVVAVKLFLARYVAGWDLSPAEAATLEFPLFVVGGVLLWRVSRLLRSIRKAVATRERGPQAGERGGTIGLSALAVIERAVWAIGLAAPALAAVGYLAAANQLLYGAILTLGLIGVCVVVYDLAIKTLGAISARPDVKGQPAGEPVTDGLLPVLIGALVTLAALPLFVLIWGARAADLAGVWFRLRDGLTFGGMRISIGTVTTFVIVFAIVYGLSRVLQTVLRGTVLPRTRMDSGGKNAVLAGVGYVGFMIAAVAAVSSTGMDLTSLAVVAGALSVGIGFGLQNIVSNFVSGIILLVERPIKEGDWIEVGGFAGYVRGISVRSTEIETFDRASVILPNSDLVAGTVLNRTHSGMSGRIQVPVTVAMESDPRLVERVLIEIAETHPLVLADPSPRVLLMEIGPDALLFEIRCWLRDVNFSLSARSDINFEILERLDAAGVRMQPFLRDARAGVASPEPASPEAQAAQEASSAPQDVEPPPKRS